MFFVTHGEIIEPPKRHFVMHVEYFAGTNVVVLFCTTNAVTTVLFVPIMFFVPPM